MDNWAQAEGRRGATDDTGSGWLVDRFLAIGAPMKRLVSVLGCIKMCTSAHKTTECAMTSTTMTVRLPEATKERLGRLAERTRRSRSFLAGEAIADYVERELAIIEGIERGIADMEAGRVVPHDEAMARIRGAIEHVQDDT